MSGERKCKGSVILDMVKIIRADKQAPWDRFLRPEDWEIVNSMVIPTEWYPIESYQRMGTAVYELVAKRNAQVVEQFGRAAMKGLFGGSYRPFLDKKDPHEAIHKFLELRKSLFNFSRMEMQKTGPRAARVLIFEIGEFQQGLDIFEQLLAAHLKELVELNGAGAATCQSSLQDVQGEKTLAFELGWE